MLRLIIFMTSLTGLFSACVQPTAECNCPENQYTDSERDTLFSLSDGERIALCGYQLPDAKPRLYSEFILTRCATDEIIDFWDATRTCRLEVDNDSLKVYELAYFAIGDSLKLREATWTTERLFYQDNELIRKLNVNRDLGSYTLNEIQQVLNEYETSDSELTEAKMELLNRLFMASISGSDEARRYFEEFRDKFNVPDGANSQEYRNLEEMLTLWDDPDH